MGLGGWLYFPKVDFTHDISKHYSQVLREKLCHFKPKIAVFNGKAIYEVYSGTKKFMFGRQPEPLEGSDGATWIWVMPSSSARLAQLPRAVDKVPFFEALKKFRDYLSGKIEKIDECDVTFASVVLKNWSRKNTVKTEPVENSEDTDTMNNLDSATNVVQAE